MLLKKTISLLQWGHAFSGVETQGVLTDLLQQAVASMGPRLFRRGNFIYSLLSPPLYKSLQWGHAFSGVETHEIEPLKPFRVGFNGATPFQAWKHILQDVGWLRSKWRFNGATPFQAWKLKG